MIHDEDVQRAWTMYTLDAVEFDIAGSRRPRDQGDRVRCPLGQSLDGFGNQPYDLFCTYRKPDLKAPVFQPGDEKSFLVWGWGEEVSPRAAMRTASLIAAASDGHP
jgi:hypothetical protein